MRCPCRKKSETVTYEACCGPLHAGVRAAPSAEALMRSRYAAFVRQDVDYLLATWAPQTRPPHITFIVGQTWLILRILTTHTDGDRATVEFLARSRIHGRIEDLHEISRFERVEGRWYYVDGVIKRAAPATNAR